jgi:hypothetical protein
MHLPCSRVRAVFAPESILLQNPGPATLIWDEHGGTFVLKVSDLEVKETAGAEAESGLWLEVGLAGSGTLLEEMTGFAAHHRLTLPAVSPPPGELTEAPILAAFHVPGRDLFIYGESTELRVRAGPESLEMAVNGVFSSRLVPCREADLVIHLTPVANARLLAYGAAALVRATQI